MNKQSLKDLVAMAFIALVSIIGVEVLVNARLGRARAAAEATYQTLSEASLDEPDADTIAQARGRARRARSWFDADDNLADESALYTRLMEVGEQADVRIDRMDPSRSTEDSGEDTFMSTSGFSLQAVGSYESMTRFIGALEESLGFSIVVRWDLTAVNQRGESLVRGALDVKHLHFDLDALKETLASGDEELEAMP